MVFVSFVVLAVVIFYEFIIKFEKKNPEEIGPGTFKYKSATCRIPTT